MEQMIKKIIHKLSINHPQPKKFKKIIKAFQTKESYGYDQISLRILKLSAPYTSTSLNYICNKIMHYGVFPERLKYSIIKPIHKKEDKSLLSNYRPISLLMSFSKIVEKIMYNRLVSHLKKYEILNPNQYDFQEKLSTDNAVYSLLNTILTALNKLKVTGIFCDIEKSI
jgi:Notch-like protein